MADTTTDNRNLEALVLGTAIFAFAPGATSLANARVIGFQDFGNIVAAGLKPEIEVLEHEGSYRGVKRVDKRVAVKSLLGYNLKCDEMTRELIKIALGGANATNITQSAQTTQNGDALAFGTTAAVIGRWYDLLISGVRIREITTVTITSLVEGTDFVVDKKLGRIRFLTAQATNRTPVITAAAITANDASSLLGITPLDTLIRTGYGRLAVFDDTHPNKVVYDHVDFSCQVSFESGADLDGKKIGEWDFKVLITDTIGTVYTAE